MGGRTEERTEKEISYRPRGLHQKQGFSMYLRIEGWPDVPGAVGCRCYERDTIRRSRSPSLDGEKPDIEQTINMGSSLGAGGTDALRAQMAHKMGYGDINPSGANRGGLGVTTGLAGLDRILNRDNSELVKKFKR